MKAGALGVLLLSASNLFRLGVQLLLFPLLARLLVPAEFGLVALVMPVVLVAMTLADGGIGPVLLRAPEPRAAMEASAFWLTLALGGALALLLVLAAPLLGRALAQPQAAPVLSWLAPVLVLSALCAVPSVRALRQGANWVFALADIGATLAGAAVALGGALAGWGAWSLVGQQLALWSLRTALLLGLLGGWPRAAPQRPALALLLGQGGPLLAANLLALAARTADTMLLGWQLGVAPLGLYGLAMQLVRIPEAVLSGPAFLAFLPAMVRLRFARAAAARLFVAALRLLFTLVAPLLLGLGLVAAQAVPLLFGPHWQGTAAVLPWLAPAGIAPVLGWLGVAVVQGRGRGRLLLRLALLNLGLTVVGVVAGLPFGLVGVAMGVALAQALGGGLQLWAALRLLRPGLVALRIALLPPLLAALVMTGGVLLWRGLLPPGLPALAMLVGGGGVFYLATLWVLAPEAMQADLAMLRRRG